MQKLTLYFLILLLPQKVFAQKYTSINDGCWLDETVWDKGIVPGFSDTIIIKSNVLFELELNFEPGGYLEIDSLGLLCVTHIFNLPCGAFFL